MLPRDPALQARHGLHAVMHWASGTDSRRPCLPPSHSAPGQPHSHARTCLQRSPAVPPQPPRGFCSSAQSRARLRMEGGPAASRAARPASSNKTRHETSSPDRSTHPAAVGGRRLPSPSSPRAAAPDMPSSVSASACHHPQHTHARPPGQSWSACAARAGSVGRRASCRSGSRRHGPRRTLRFTVPVESTSRVTSELPSGCATGEAMLACSTSAFGCAINTRAWRPRSEPNLSTILPDCRTCHAWHSSCCQGRARAMHFLISTG